MRKFLSILSFLLSVVVFVAAIVSIEGLDSSHTHTYEEDWSSDADNHWHAATCEHTEEKGSLEAHVDSNGDEMCDVCGYSSAAHHYSSILSSDDTGHWYACTDPGCNERKDFAPHNDADRDGECDDCFHDGMHRHSWNTAAWRFDDNQHWNPATCGSDCPDVVADLKGNIADHVDEDEDGECDICDFGNMHRHTFDETEWVSDESGHWYEATCEHSAKKGSFAVHTDEDEDFICDECDFVIHEHTFADELTQGDGEHYYASTCGHDVKKDLAACADTDSDNECDTCGAHVHGVDDSEWLEDETGHWHATTCSHDPAVKADFSEHVDEDSDNTCDTCGFHAHSWDTDWSGDTNQHWHAAICPGHEDVKKDVEAHVDADSDTLCDTCGLSTIGPIAGVNAGTWDKTAYSATPTGTISGGIKGDDDITYTVTWKSYDVATFDAAAGKMVISKKTVVDSIKNGTDDVVSFVKDGRTYQVGTVLDKSEQGWTTEVLSKITATDVGISPNSLAFQFRANVTVNANFNSRMPNNEYNQLLINEGKAAYFSLSAHDGKVYLSTSIGWLDTGVEVGEEFALAVRMDRVNNAGKTTYLMTIYVNGAKFVQKPFDTCPDSLTFKTYSATRDLELVMTDVYCDSYGIRYEGATATTTTTVWEKDGAFSTTEIADGNKYDIEWFKSGAITTDDVTGVVTSQDKRIAIKSIKDAEGNETAITYGGVTYKAGECYIPKNGDTGWLGLGSAFWGSAPRASFTSTEALKTGSTLYEFKTTMTVNDYGAYGEVGVGNVLEMRLFSGNTQKEIVYFTVSGGPSGYIDWSFNGVAATIYVSRGVLRQTLEIRIVVTESAEAGKMDISVYGKTQGASAEGLLSTKTVDAYDLTEVAFDAPSNARYQTTVFENTTFTKYVTELTPEPAPAE